MQERIESQRIGAEGSAGVATVPGGGHVPGAAGRAQVDRKARLNYLESLRGLAALAVLVFHYQQAYAPPKLLLACARTPLVLFWDGPAAVSLFFVLSGLVLSYRHFRTTPQPTLQAFGYGGFVVERACRIWLPYAAVVIVTSLVPRSMGSGAGHAASGLTSTSWAAFYWQTPVWPLSVRQLVRELLIFRMEVPALVPQGWTLSVELAVSLLVPVGILLASRSAAWLVLTVAVASVSLRATPYLVHFAIGILIAQRLEWVRSWLAPRRAAWLCVAAAGVLLYTLRSTVPVDWGWPGKPPIWWATGTGAGLLICAIIASPRLQSALSGQVLRRFGRYSYGIYLTHITLLLNVTPVMLSHLPRLPAGIAWALGLGLTVATSFLSGAIIHVCAETPSTAFGHGIASRMANRD